MTLHGGNSGMTSHPADALLSEPAPSSPFLCPGHATPVSRAVHLARLHAGWSGCDQCDWRNDLEGLAESARQQLTRIRQRRMGGVRRTEFGIRGVWLNDLTRARAAWLMHVFCDSLYGSAAAAAHPQRPTSVAGAGRTAEHPAASDSAASAITRPALVTGYDGRPSSLDIFAGTLSAIRECGFPVIDIGRCTAASLLEAARSLPETHAAVLVTGSGTPPSWTGFDVFDREGHPLPVRWDAYGIRLTALSEPLKDSVDAVASESADRGPGRADPAAESIVLELPSRSDSGFPARRTRSSGSCRSLPFEQRYRRTLLRWFPDRSSVPVGVATGDALVTERVHWLMTHGSLNLHTHSPSGTPDKGARPHLELRIPEDDRSFTLVDRNGCAFRPDELADRINRAIQSRSSHVTAHADAASGRFWLTDAARTSSASSTEQITDALAALGLLLRLIADDRLPAVLHAG